eukprot:TRINITY_DN21417_c0_g1_i1.p1 TRINITY_DN21417_c0_g1~~TRINITY_DN21417_c0_g1_i1.p1  ORF type:complete len:365 (+),score=61.25 TRINITY_DN21417_c0_g1_i1:43-1137(+)
MKREAQSDWSQMMDMKKRRSAQGVQGGLDAEQMEVLAAQALEAKKGMVKGMVATDKLRRQEEYFDVPEWAGMPCGGVHLCVFKGEKQIDTIMIDGCPYYLFGRNSQVCDVPLEHPSVSRVHVALVHHEKSKSTYIIDLKTQHGTFINDTKLPHKKPVKITPEDRLRVGMSTRSFKLVLTPPARPAKPETKHIEQAEEKPPVMTAEQEKERDAQAKAASIEIRNRGNKTEHKVKADFWDGIEVKKSVSPVPEPAEDTSLGPVKISHILLDGNTAKATAQLTSAKQEILLNMDGRGTAYAFGKYAKKHSICTSASKKGLLGTLPHLPVPIDASVLQLASSLKPDSVSNPVASQQGVHLLYRHSNDQ